MRGFYKSSSKELCLQKKNLFFRKNENFSAIYGFSTFIGTALRVLGADVFFFGQRPGNLKKKLEKNLHQQNSTTKVLKKNFWYKKELRTL